MLILPNPTSQGCLNGWSFWPLNVRGWERRRETWPPETPHLDGEIVIDRRHLNAFVFYDRDQGSGAALDGEQGDPVAHEISRWSGQVVGRQKLLG